MNDSDFTSGNEARGEQGQGNAAGRPRFPWERLFYAVGFGIVAWFVFWLLIALSAVQFILLLIQALTPAVTGHPSEELKRFNLRMLQYLLELLAYVTFVRDALPFPFAPFPAAPAQPGG
jgi:Flp pilus assembly protein TadB